MDRNRPRLLDLVFVLAAFAVSAALYNRLPDPVPIHWGWDGTPNGFMAKPFGAFVMPAIMAVYYVLARVRRRSPSAAGDDSGRVKAILNTTIMGFLFFGTVLGHLAAIGAPVSIGRSGQAGLGVLLMVVGNYMGKIRRNFFLGIRTPWTLASDEVWLRTHRFGGRVWVLGGVALFLLAVTGAGAWATGVCMTILVGLPFLYSWLVFMRLGRDRD
jgi:uncharacterized membrane protein